MRTDSEIQRDIEDELRWDPSLENDDIAVSVRDGVVTLAGYVKSYLDKWHAERVASGVKGVKAIADDLSVKLPSSSERPDPDIARAALDEGDVDWNFQREAAEKAVRALTGVKGVTNLITIKVSPTPKDVKQKIKEALERGAQFDADRITVEIDGNKAILMGTVRSYAERRDAERAARNAPGITEVENKLTVDPSIFAGV